MVDGIISKNRQDIKKMDSLLESYNHLMDEATLGYGSLGSVQEIKQRIIDNKSSINDSFNPDVMSTRGLSWNIAALDEIMRQEPYIINAVTWQATKALTNGIDLNIRKDGNNDLETSRRINEYIFNNLLKPLVDFYSQGASYGGSGGLITINGERDVDLKKPLTWKNIKYGDKINIRPLTRLYQVQPMLEPNEDMWITETGEHVGLYDSTELGKPKWWRVSISGSFFNKTKNNYSFDYVGNENMFVNTQVVHRSRLIIYNGSELSWIEKQMEQYFGVSLIVKSLESIKRYKQSLDEIMSLLKRSNVPVINMETKSTGSKTSQHYLKQVEDTILSYYYGMENGGIIVLGPKEKEQLQFIQAEFKELTNILLDRKKELSADLGAPVSVTFNEEPKIEEHISYYGVHNTQERQLRPAFTQLIPLIYRAVKEDAGYLKETDYSFKFKSLEYISNKDKVEQQHKMGTLVKDLYDSDVLDRYEARQILISSADNVSDVFQDLKLESKDIGIYASDIKIRVAEALNQSKFNPQNENGKTYNPSQAGVAGEVLGGNQQRTKTKGIDIK